ncbi:MAG: hypothetical protein ACJAV1_003275 [Paraglaciecola sp.]|jgi:hypothetical protein
MEILVSAAVLGTLFSGLFLYGVHRLNRNHVSIENNMTRAHAESLASVNSSLSKEAHAANHLYTRKAICFEEASKIVGDLIFWAEKCVVPSTSFDFGTKKEIADKMAKSFEDLRLYTLQYSAFFNESADLQSNLCELMESVNHIQNMVNSDGFSAGQPSWVKAVDVFRRKLTPVASTFKKEIHALMSQNS